MLTQLPSDICPDNFQCIDGVLIPQSHRWRKLEDARSEVDHLIRYVCRLCGKYSAVSDNVS
jgi:hypothetical protein